tara:strand:- start:82 stop:669 length:588 start_codon:yes stop_codon:yes gene_type:complete
VRGYFGIGVEGINKAYNLGNLFRSAHAFDASFVFTIASTYERRVGNRSDTSNSLAQVPFYEFPTVDSMSFPKGCTIVGVELDNTAIDLPSFRHPPQACYILGPERGSLSKGLMAKCEYIVKIPTRFCLNVGIAGVLVMYDRLISSSGFAARPVTMGGGNALETGHKHGAQIIRTAGMDQFSVPPPLDEVDLVTKS